MKVFAFLALSLLVSTAAALEPSGVHDFEVKSIEGQTVDLKDYQGKVLLVVNVASRCGLTPQYAALQELYSQHEKDGLVVLGFPCNQFRGQEPGTNAEIKEFCSTNYKVSFPLFSKIDVNGDDAAPLYQYLTAQKTQPVEAGEISWNFEKFLIGRDGKVLKRFSPRVAPDSDEVRAAIKAAL